MPRRYGFKSVHSKCSLQHHVRPAGSGHRTREHVLGSFSLDRQRVAKDAWLVFIPSSAKPQDSLLPVAFCASLSLSLCHGRAGGSTPEAWNQSCARREDQRRRVFRFFYMPLLRPWQVLTRVLYHACCGRPSVNHGKILGNNSY